MSDNMHLNTISTPNLLIQHGYQYLELIGEGANGKTYKAKNLKTGEIVAVKELKFSENLKNYELFEREAETLKSLHTPGTPHFYDYITGEKEFTECWLVQEYVEGISILDKLEKGIRFNEVQTLQMMLQTADIVRMLQMMYTPPIIHRDIKPSNILVRNTPKDGMTCCLIDFGAVANPQRRGINSTVAGTVGYMAPEQLIGDCSIQSDYYAIGATGLHMLTGTPPSKFESNGFQLQFEEQLKSAIPDIHKETIDLFRKLLSPDASDRPQNSIELIKLISTTLKSFNDTSSIRRRLILKKRILEKFYDGNPSITLLGVLTLIGLWFPFCYFMEYLVSFVENHNLTNYKGEVLLTSVIVFFIFLIIMFFVMRAKFRSYKTQLASLPNYDAISVMDYAPKLPQELLLSDNALKAIGTVQAIFGDIVEFSVTVDHKSFSAYCRQSDSGYKVGDKLNILYSKFGNRYRFQNVIN